MLDFLGMLGNYEERKVDNTTVVSAEGSIEIDTVRVTDSDKPFETGICSPIYNGGDWVIVELYDTKDEAIEGHKKWVKKMDNPPRQLKDVSTSTIAKLCKIIAPQKHN